MRSHRIKRRQHDFVWMTLVAATLVTGCSEPIAESPIEMMAIEANAVGYTDSSDHSSSQCETETVVSEFEPSAESPQNVAVDGQPERSGESSDTAIPEGVNFFAPQRSTAVAVEVTSEDDKQQMVRLVGLVNESGEPDESAVALIRIEKKLLPLGIGQSAHDITLLSIDPKGRTATIQHERERLTLVMMNQPIENAVTAAPRPRLFPKASGKTRRVDDVADSFEAPQIEMPDSEPLLPSFEDEPPLSMPQNLDLPDLPDLPGLDELTDAL